MSNPGMPDPGMSDQAVLEATGRDWPGWKARLDAAGAADMEHAAIVRSLKGEIDRGWWRQMVTVGYERMIGRRVVGQTCAGSYSASASRTVAGDMDAALGKWRELLAERAEFADALAVAEPRVSNTTKWRYWRIDLDDGSKVNVTFSAKPGDKSVIGVNHDRLADADAAARAKTFWKELLQQV